MSSRLVVGTRGSLLALRQSTMVAEQIRDATPGLEVTLEVIQTTGDKITDSPLSRIGAKGLFTKELEVALLEGRIDLAIHSLKDLPTELPEGLALGPVPLREDPHDALVSVRWSAIEELPTGARVGTSSLRRAAQLRALRPDLEVVDLRGNVDTRIRKVSDGVVDAAIMACAGLRRLGHGDVIRQAIEPEVMVPAVSQGALGLEVRQGDTRTLELLAPLADAATALEIRAERTLLATLEGGCQVPIGALARARGHSMTLVGCVASVDGAAVLKAFAEGPSTEPEAIGERVAADLLRQGAGELIAAAR